MRNDSEGLGFLAFILGGVVVVVLTLALIAYRAQNDDIHGKRAELGPTLAWVAQLATDKR